MANEKETSGGIGFCGLLTIAFIVLKLCGVIAWSWWWVTSPLWIPVAIVIMMGIVWLSFEGVKAYKKSKTAKEKLNKMVNGEQPKSRWQVKYDELVSAQNKSQERKSRLS